MNIAVSQRETDIAQIVAQLIAFFLSSSGDWAAGDALCVQLAEHTDLETASAIVGGVMAGLAQAGMARS